ncbi:Alpha/Beta hydrolase protein [Staphylotrichum tortipilum]|uniref:Alpha/Beta hydrolase protein n=1 Tax=Staphylotrichum tortipilum TaxID=2831512 RepID=A0AAN6MRD7_9PEZI|nr:Alpha/Beta hydrolase protein [Staphylotrichum longicolle]
MTTTQPVTKVATIKADGVDVFYRTAGPADAPTVILLHGFPSSSHMFRNLIPLLATRYRVVAPDLPGFGFTTVPAERNYAYTFANLAQTFGAFVDALSLSRFAIYIFDYGAPTGFRFALSRPDAIAAIISQNGNAYDEGLGQPFWSQIEKLWASGAQSDRDALRPLLELPATQWQYQNGHPQPESIQPEAFYLDQALMDRPGNKEIQLDLFHDYGSNVKLYPQFQEYLRSSRVPVLAAWGKQDEIFVAPGSEAFRKDVAKLETRWLDAGHFALEINEEQMAEWIIEFFDKHQVFAA